MVLLEMVMKKKANEVSISRFKANRFALLAKVHRTRRPLQVTPFGKLVATIFPATQAQTRKPRNQRVRVGSMTSMDILGDILSPANAPNEWECLR
jgi:hypothetical protein